MTAAFCAPCCFHADSAGADQTSPRRRGTERVDEGGEADVETKRKNKMRRQLVEGGRAAGDMSRRSRLETKEKKKKKKATRDEISQVRRGMDRQRVR